jgi:hypothetical protein
MNIFAIREDEALAFGRRYKEFLARRDVAAWAALLGTLQTLRCLPHLTQDGRLTQDSHPLVDFAWHLPPVRPRPTFVVDTLPEPGSEEIEWLLMRAILQTAEMRLETTSSRFEYQWTDEMLDQGLILPGIQQEAHALFVNLLFERQGNVPVEVSFLGAASSVHSYIARSEVMTLADLNARSGLARHLEVHYRSRPEEGFHEVGRDIAMLGHLVALSAASERALFTCHVGAV